MNSYQQSKYEAEELLFEAMRDVPASIFRLSTIISDSNGKVRQFNYYHQLVKLVPRNPFPNNSWESRGRNRSYRKRLASLRTGIALRVAFCPWPRLPYMRGPEAFHDRRRNSALDVHIFNQSRTKPTMQPRLVSLDEFERFARQQAGIGNAPVRELLRVLREFLPHLAIPQYYDTQYYDNGETLV